MASPLPDALPDPENDGGIHGTWRVTDRTGKTAEIVADFLGHGSSFRPSHSHIFPPHAERGTHCSTCRWSETWIFQEGHQDPEGRFVVVSYGRSVVPREITFVTFGYADSVEELIKVLTLQPNGRHAVTPPVSRALEMASVYSPEIDRAYHGSDR